MRAEKRCGICWPAPISIVDILRTLTSTLPKIMWFPSNMCPVMKVAPRYTTMTVRAQKLDEGDAEEDSNSKSQEASW